MPIMSGRSESGRRAGAGRRRPLGRATRGKTAANRLRRVDALVLLHDESLLRREDGPWREALYVDLGFGAEPTTTLESARRFRRVNPRLRVLGVEIDAQRVAVARAHEDRLTHFRLGGFDLPLSPGETVRLVRAFNVLRQYEESAVAQAREWLSRALLPGGLLVEGTSEPHGRHWVAELWRRGEVELRREALCFGTSFRAGFDPAAFQPVLPKGLIHRVVEGEPIHDFFADWKQAAKETSGESTWGPRRWFAASAELLVERGWRVDRRRRLIERGYLLLSSLERD